MQQYLVIDLGGTFVKFARADENGNFSDSGKLLSACSSLKELLSIFDRVKAQFECNFDGVAISMPGCINTANGIAHTGGSFTFIHDAPIEALLEERFHCPVTIANDGKCAASAELWKGALHDVQDGVVIVLGTGTGGGVVLNGQVRMGHTLGAGEFSFLGTDFAKLAKGINGLDDDNVESIWSFSMSATGLLRFYRLHKHLPSDAPLDGFAFFRAYDAGEPEAHAALKEFGRFAAAGIYSIQSVLDVPRFAIGGGISARSEVVQAIRQAVDAQFASIPFTAFGKPEIVSCQFGNDANLIGALAFHLEKQAVPAERG